MAAPAGAGAGAPALTAALDIESLVIMIVSASKKKLLLEKGAYELADPTDDGMLAWAGMDRHHKNAELQDLPIAGFARVGTVGDGNCMLHTILYALSPTYRAHNRAARSTIADEFRKVLVARRAELEGLADIIYFEAGGATAFEEMFEILDGRREELNIEMGPLIGRLYNFNFLAVQVRTGMAIVPVCITLLGYQRHLPTVVTNYIGGAVNVGNRGAAFEGGGHYEALLRPVITAAAPTPAAGRRTTHKRTASPTESVVGLDEVRTVYLFDFAELRPILEMFRTSCAATRRLSSNRRSGSGKGAGAGAA